MEEQIISKVFGQLSANYFSNTLSGRRQVNGNIFSKIY